MNDPINVGADRFRAGIMAVLARGRLAHMTDLFEAAELTTGQLDSYPVDDVHGVVDELRDMAGSASADDAEYLLDIATLLEFAMEPDAVGARTDRL